MIITAKFGRLPGALWIVVSCICLFTSQAAIAAGISIQYGNGHHGISTGHHGSHGAVGNLKINRQSPHYHSNRNSSHYTHQRQHNNYYYSFPRYRSYSSPRQHYYNKAYTQPYFNSRFPNSYRNYSYYQQPTPRYYGNNVNYSVNAWESLAQGDPRRALSQFWVEAQSYPKAGLPKIGYALSSAASGDLKQAVVAMRRAFKIDPDSLRHYKLDPRLQPLVNNLIASYQYSRGHRGRRKNEAFMVAALSYLNHDYATAYQALERAERDGDRSRSFRNLRDFLRQEKIAGGH